MLTKLVGITPNIAKKYKYLWNQEVLKGKRNHGFGVASKSDQSLPMPLKTRPDSQHRTHAEIHGKIPDCVNRAKFPKITEQALKAGCGWHQSGNPNRGLLLSSSLGSITWHVNGNLIIYANRVGNVSEQKLMANVKTLVYRSFIETELIADQGIVDAFLASIQWHDQHDVYETGSTKSLPHMIIKNPYFASLGIPKVTSGDGSHKYGIEFEVTYPPILKNYEQMVVDLTGLLEKAFANSKIEKDQLMKMLESIVTPNTAAINDLHAYLQDLGITKVTKKPDVGRLYE
jgi:hypothetical protein